MALLNQISPEDIYNDIRYLELLAQNFRNIAAASTEIINLEAILNLPKGTEHFLADIHGEYEAFQHVLKMVRVQSNAKSTRSLETPYGNLKKRALHSDLLSP